MSSARSTTRSMLGGLFVVVLAFGPLCLVVGGAVAPIPALAQVSQEPETDLGGAHIVGYITDITGAVVLVEEDPSTSPSPYQSPYELGKKVAFTVTRKTSILR